MSHFNQHRAVWVHTRLTGRFSNLKQYPAWRSEQLDGERWGALLADVNEETTFYATNRREDWNK